MRGKFPAFSRFYVFPFSLCPSRVCCARRPQAGKLEFVQWLIKNKVDVLAKDGSTPDGGKTAYMLAKEKQLESVCQALQAVGGAVGAPAGGCCVIS